MRNFLNIPPMVDDDPTVVDCRIRHAVEEQRAAEAYAAQWAAENAHLIEEVL